MKRSPKPNESSAQRGQAPRKNGTYWAVRAFFGLLLSLLQLGSALHFTLIPHSFSAASGGIVHTHERPAHGPRVTVQSASVHAELTRSDEPPCVVDLCPCADAAHGGVPNLALGISGPAAFGEPVLLGRARTRTAPERDLFSCAPKTSPPA